MKNLVTSTTTLFSVGNSNFLFDSTLGVFLPDEKKLPDSVSRKLDTLIARSIPPREYEELQFALGKDLARCTSQMRRQLLLVTSKWAGFPEESKARKEQIVHNFFAKTQTLEALYAVKMQVVPTNYRKVRLTA